MQLKPVLGPVQLVFYSAGIIIGAGVYSVIGTAAGLAQQGLWASIIAALVALLALREIVVRDTAREFDGLFLIVPIAGMDPYTALWIGRAEPAAH